MSSTRSLVSWIGNADIKQAALTGPLGPLESVLRQSNFDALFLLYDKPEEEVEPFLSHIRNNYNAHLTPHPVSLRDPTHFGDIYRALDGLLLQITKNPPKSEVTLQITSGTPSMTAVSILLGKAKYCTKFIQSSREQGVLEPEIPFDIAADFLPTRSNAKTNGLTSLFAGEAPDTAAFSDIVSQSAVMEVLKQKAAILAKRDVPVLLYGETGTGKELLARAIHNASNRANKPMLVLNCGAIPKDLIDTTLFGHDKGAFTGATTSNEGYFEKANGGTLFLDEFGELPLDSQVRLLRVLQQGTYNRVGSTNERIADVRIITATNKDLVKEVAENRFREDLFYRVAIGVLHLPPIRERTGDLSFLAKALLERINEEAGVNPDYIHKYISANAINLILRQPWSGNVRELQATLLRATLWQAGSTLTEDDIAQALIIPAKSSENILDADISQGIEINEIIEIITKHYVMQAMDFCHGSKIKAAALLGLKNYQTLNNWIKKYNIK
jgi:transcriptional regulator with PAS, ATPase and Fis domain